MAYPSGTPVDEAIVADLTAALGGIATPAYHTDVRQALRFDPENGVNLQTFPAIVVGPAAVSWDDTVHGLLSGTLTTTVRGFVQARTQPATTLAWLAADIRKALLDDYTRGGVALTTRILDQATWTLDESAHPIHGIDVQVLVLFRHLYDDPNSPI